MNNSGSMLYTEEDPRIIPFTPEQMQKLAELYRDGRSPQKIGNLYGISAFTVRRRLVAMGVEIRGKGVQGYLVTVKVLATAKAMRDSGSRWKEVEAATGVKSDTLMLALRRERKRNTGE